MEQIVETYYAMVLLALEVPELSDMAHDFYAHMIDDDYKHKEFAHYYMKLLRKKDKEVPKDYQYMFTFTLDPKKNELNEQLYAKVEKYIIKFVKNTTQLKVYRMEYVREGGDKDHKHIHWYVGVKCKRYADKKIFYTYLKKYGKIDVSVSKKKKDFNDILNYINKTNKSTRVL